MNLVKLLGQPDNFDVLKKEVMDLVASKLATENQLSLQTTLEDTGDWYSSAGTVLKLKNKNEREYNVLQPELKGTAIESIINKYNATRSRIMISRPRSCYSVHKDDSYRIHIPIVTNPQSWMVWPYQNKCVNLEEGNVYWTNTTRYHSVFNGSLVDRIHLVMCVFQPV